MYGDEEVENDFFKCEKGVRKNDVIESENWNASKSALGQRGKKHGFEGLDLPVGKTSKERR